MPTFKYAVPIFLVTNLDDALTFYTEKLGFAQGFRVGDYAGLMLGPVELHLSQNPAHIPEGAISCYVYVEEGIEALHEQMKAAGVVHPNGALADKDWGQREFAVLDPDNNLITFGQEIEGA